MRVIAKSTLRSFWEKHPESRDGLEAWYRIAKHATWANYAELAGSVGDVESVGDRLIFNINHNRYRLIVRPVYQMHLLYIRFVGTHDEYRRINAKEV